MMRARGPVPTLMNIDTIHRLLAGLLLAVACLLPSAAPALDFEDVKPYEEVFVISASAPSRDRVEVQWAVAPEHYLYHNRFLRFEAVTPGVALGSPDVPEGEQAFDELLGEDVIKFHDELVVGVPVSAGPAVASLTLKVQSQGCLDKVLCYPPTQQFVTVTLPPAASVAPGASISDALSGAAASGPLISDPLGDGAAQDGPLLQPEDAFQYEAIGLDAATVLVRITAQPDHYLYVDKFAFRVVEPGDISVAGFERPEGTLKDDPEFGVVPVIFGQVEIPVKLNRPAGPATELVLEAAFQGCRDGEICYPPDTRQVTLELDSAREAILLPSLEDLGSTPATGVGDTAEVAGAGTSANLPVSEQDRLAGILLENPALALLLFFVAGLALAFTPCVFPMVPILSGIIAGRGESIDTRGAFWLSLVYVLAMALTYTAAGVLAGLFGQNLQAAFQNPWVITATVVVIVALALSMFGFYELQLPSRWQTRLSEASNRQQGGSLWGVAVMGFLSALIVGPCVAPPLAAALIVIGSSGDPVLGGSALFALSLGMGVPLLVFGTSAGKWIPRAGGWMDAVKAVFGVGLLALAIWMLERLVQGPVILLLWGVLAIASGVYMGALEPLKDAASGWRRLWKALGVVLIVLGLAELVGAASGSDDWLRPLNRLSGGAAHGEAAEHVEFRRIKSLADLETAVTQAAASGKPAMLDFYADWCVECIRMERRTFPEPRVQALLAQVQPLQADVTAHDETDQALMREFGIIGPPAILFFDRNGDEMPAYRLVGFFTADEFSAHLQRVLDDA